MELKYLLKKSLLFVLDSLKKLIENIINNLQKEPKNNKKKDICTPEIREIVQNYLEEEILSFKREALNYYLTLYKERVNVIEEGKIFEKYEKKFTKPFFGLSFRNLNYYEEKCLYKILQNELNSNFSGMDLIEEYEKKLLKEAEKEAIEILSKYPSYKEE